MPLCVCIIGREVVDRWLAGWMLAVSYLPLVFMDERVTSRAAHQSTSCKINELTKAACDVDLSLSLLTVLDSNGAPATQHPATKGNEIKDTEDIEKH